MFEFFKTVPFVIIASAILLIIIVVVVAIILIQFSKDKKPQEKQVLLETKQEPTKEIQEPVKKIDYNSRERIFQKIPQEPENFVDKAPLPIQVLPKTLAQRNQLKEEKAEIIYDKLPADIQNPLVIYEKLPNMQEISKDQEKIDSSNVKQTLKSFIEYGKKN